MVDVIGGGLAGCEAAWQVAQKGIPVRLFEMRPFLSTGAHVGNDLAELVCSNSFGSQLTDRASGVLLEELRRLGSILVACAEKTSLPAGGSLAVDRFAFARLVTETITAHPNIEIIRQEIKEVPDGVVIIASGPLTSAALSDSIGKLSGENHLFFYDAIAPIIEYDSINMDKAYRASRYGRGVSTEGDYINCPLTREEYDQFYQELISAERFNIRNFEGEIKTGVRAGAKEYFEGCLPVEVLAERGNRALTFGPMRPIGLYDSRTGKRAYAVVQLRQDNLAGSFYNMVGFQTNLTYPEQKEFLA